MNRKVQAANPFSTGGGGLTFETEVQSAFVLIMLVGGYVPGILGDWPVNKIKLQAKGVGINTDDLIVFAKDQMGTECKLLGQIKHQVRVTKRDEVFGEVIRSAWQDFNNPKSFSINKDVIA